MALLVIETTEGVPLEREIAGAGARGLALLIDLVLWGLSILLLGSFLSGLASVDRSGASSFLLAAFSGGAFLVLVAYTTLVPLALDGRTLGKAALGLRVRDLRGHPAGALQHLVRSLFLLLEVLPVPVPIGFLVLAGSSEGQRLGDVVAGTLVLRDPARVAAEPFASLGADDLPERRLVLTPALVARFDRQDLGFLRGIFTSIGLERGARSRLVFQAAREYAARLEQPAPRSASAAAGFLRELYIVLRERL